MAKKRKPKKSERVYKKHSKAREIQDKQGGLNRIEQVQGGWVVKRIIKRKTTKKK